MTGSWMWWLCHKIRKHHVWYLKVKLIIQEGKIYFIIRCHDQKHIFNVRIFFFLMNKTFFNVRIFFVFSEWSRCQSKTPLYEEAFLFCDSFHVLVCFFKKMKVFFCWFVKGFWMNWFVFWLSFRKICLFFTPFFVTDEKNFLNGIKIYSIKEAFMCHFSFIVIMDE